MLTSITSVHPSRRQQVAVISALSRSCRLSAGPFHGHDLLAATILLPNLWLPKTTLAGCRPAISPLMPHCVAGLPEQHRQSKQTTPIPAANDKPMSTTASKVTSRSRRIERRLKIATTIGYPGSHLAHDDDSCRIVPALNVRNIRLSIIQWRLV